MPNVDESILVAQARDNPQAFAALYDRYVDRIFRYAYRLMQDEAAAQDVTAVTFEKALRRLRQFQWQGTSIAAWLYRIARNEAMSQHRKRKWLAPWQANGRTTGRRATETAVLAHEQRDRLHHALDQLSAKDRDLLTLRFLEGLSSAEVADVLDCSIDNVYLRVHRALQRLRRQLDLLDAQGEVLTHVTQK